MRRRLLLPVGVHGCDSGAVSTGQLQRARVSDVHAVSAGPIWRGGWSDVASVQWAVRCGLVRWRVRADHAELQRAVCSGVLLPAWVDDADVGAVSRGDVQRRRGSDVHRLCRRLLRLIHGADGAHVQWAVCIGVLRQHDWTDDVQLQRPVCGGLRVSRGVLERDGERVWHRQLQRGRVVGVYAVPRGAVRLDERTADVGVQWTVCGRAVWQRQWTERLVVQRAVCDWFCLSSRFGVANPVAVSQGQLQQRRRDVLQLQRRSVRRVKRSVVGDMLRPVRRWTVRQFHWSDCVVVPWAVRTRVLLPTRFHQRDSVQVSSRDVQCGWRWRVHQLQRGTVRCDCWPVHCYLQRCV